MSEQIPEEYKQILEKVQKQFIAMQVSMDNFVALANNAIATLMQENFAMKQQLKAKPDEKVEVTK